MNNEKNTITITENYSSNKSEEVNDKESKEIKDDLYIEKFKKLIPDTEDVIEKKTIEKNDTASEFHNMLSFYSCFLVIAIIILVILLVDYNTWTKKAISLYNENTTKIIAILSEKSEKIEQSHNEDMTISPQLKVGKYSVNTEQINSNNKYIICGFTTPGEKATYGFTAINIEEDDEYFIFKTSYNYTVKYNKSTEECQIYDPTDLPYLIIHDAFFTNSENDFVGSDSLSYYEIGKIE